MAIVSYNLDEMPPMTDEQITRLQALAKRPDSEIDFSDIPETDEFDFKYAMPFKELMAMSVEARRELGRKMLAAKEADRAAKKAREEVEQAIAEARQLAHQT